MNGRQLLAVLAGIAVFLAGALLGLRRVEPPLEDDGKAAVVPLLDAGAVLQAHPEQLALSGALLLLGLAIAGGGLYVCRDR